MQLNLINLDSTNIKFVIICSKKPIVKLVFVVQREAFLSKFMR